MRLPASFSFLLGAAVAAGAPQVVPDAADGPKLGVVTSPIGPDLVRRYGLASK
jgi:hypothetical protein